MGKKYLDIKKDSLEDSILNVWQTAAEEAGTKMDGRTKGYKSHRSKLEARRAKREEKRKFGEETYKVTNKDLGVWTGGARSEKEAKEKAMRKWGVRKSGPASVSFMKNTEIVKEEGLDEARQLKDPKKEMLVTKGGKVITIDKKDQDDYLKKGWKVAESVEIDEAKDHVFRVTSGNKQGNVHAKDEKEAVKKAKTKGMKGDIKVTDMGVYKGQPSLKESVLDIWQTAAESYEIGTDEYREYLERLTPGETIEEKKGDKEAYQKFFNSALKKFGVKSPAELKGDKKKEFFDYVDKNWTGDHEEAFEFAKESKISSIVDTIKNMWQMNEGELPPALKKAIDDKKKDKEEKDEDKEIKGNKTLTGKKPAVVEVDPEPDLGEKKKKKSGNPHY